MERVRRTWWGRRALSSGLLALLVLAGCGVGSASGTKAKPTVRPPTVPPAQRTRIAYRRKLAAARRREAARTAPLRHYSSALLPVLHRSAQVFDQASRAASSASGDQLNGICQTYASQVTILESQADGVPHPYMWYTRVGLLHHRVMGVYHQMGGALDGCLTALESSGDTSTSVSDIAQAAGSMHQLVADVTGDAHRI